MKNVSHVRPRILHAAKLYPPAGGGMETVLRDLCDGTAREWHVEVVAANDRSETRRERCGAESLASENRSRLTAMQRAEKNIDDLLEQMNRNYRRVRQDSIDSELFEVIAGFEAMEVERI